MARGLTRREMYDLVWERPATKVAADLGISDVALHKICRKHRVPTPGRGYWRRAETGKWAKRALFCEVPDPAIDRARRRTRSTLACPLKYAHSEKTGNRTAQANRLLVLVLKIQCVGIRALARANKGIPFLRESSPGHHLI